MLKHKSLFLNVPNIREGLGRFGSHVFLAWGVTDSSQRIGWSGIQLGREVVQNRNLV